MKNSLTLFLSAVLFSLLQGSLFADEPSYMILDEIVVKNKIEEKLKPKPGFETVITREDINRSSLVSLFDILEKEASISIRTDSGSEKFSVIDLRGMGETAGSNTLIVLDGVPLNSSDMSGQGLSDLPVDMIERIEIERGSGAVLYGNGAVSGVVRIFTRRPDGDIASIEVSKGSFGFDEKKLFLGHKGGKLSIFLNSLVHSEDGYRDNGHYDKSSFFGSVNMNLSDRLSMGLTLDLLNDDYGLPGAVPLSYIDDEEKRRKTDFPDDYGITRKKSLGFNMKARISKNRNISFTAKRSFKDNPYIIGYSPLILDEDQKNRISSDSDFIEFLHEVELFGNRIKTGVSHTLDNYVRDEKTSSSRKNGLLSSNDIFINDFFERGRLKLSFGSRFAFSDSKFREDKISSSTAIAGDEIEHSYFNSAYEGRAGYDFKELPLNIFFILSKSFRNPNIDELALSDGSISAQSSFNKEMGFKYSFGQFGRLTASYFILKTENEIFYGEGENGGRYNRNYDEMTIRKGVDIEADFYPLPSLFIKLSGSFIDAEFEGSGEEIPLVAGEKFNSYIEYEPFHDSFIFFDHTFVSSVKQGGDIHHDLDSIPSWSVMNMGIRKKYGHGSLFFRVDNLTNELYATSSYENSSYPMPGRSITAGFKLEF